MSDQQSLDNLFESTLSASEVNANLTYADCLEEGSVLLEKNEFLRDLLALTNAPVFRTFYDKYFDSRSQSSDNIMLLYIHLHYLLEKKYTYSSSAPEGKKEEHAGSSTVSTYSSKDTQLGLPDALKAAMITRVMSDPLMLRQLVKTFQCRNT